MTRRIELHIDRLILDGVPPHEAHSWGRATAEALSRSLAQTGLGETLQTGPAIERVDAGRLELGHGAPASTQGAKVGHAVARALGASGRRR